MDTKINHKETMINNNNQKSVKKEKLRYDI